jgi:hypothetical protein
MRYFKTLASQPDYDSLSVAALHVEIGPSCPLDRKTSWFFCSTSWRLIDVANRLQAANVWSLGARESLQTNCAVKRTVPVCSAESLALRARTSLIKKHLPTAIFACARHLLLRLVWLRHFTAFLLLAFSSAVDVK